MSARNNCGAEAVWNATARFLFWIVALMTVWEILQLPLYTLWTTASWREQAFAILHCTAGDAVIALTALVASVLLANRTWPRETSMAMQLAFIAMAAGYTVYSEWINLQRGNWAYSVLMPTLPWLGTGLSPLLQWIIVPPIALALARRPKTPAPSG